MGTLTQLAYRQGKSAALSSFGAEKVSGVVAAGAKLLGAIPGGVNNLVAGGLSAGAAGLENMHNAAPGVVNQGKAFFGAALPAATAGIPGGAGMALSTAAQVAQPKINSALGVKPAAPLPGQVA